MFDKAFLGALIGAAIAMIGVVIGSKTPDYKLAGTVIAAGCLIAFVSFGLLIYQG